MICLLSGAPLTSQEEHLSSVLNLTYGHERSGSSPNSIDGNADTVPSLSYYIR